MFGFFMIAVAIYLAGAALVQLARYVGISQIQVTQRMDRIPAGDQNSQHATPCDQCNAHRSVSDIQYETVRAMTELAAERRFRQRLDGTHPTGTHDSKHRPTRHAWHH